MAVRFCQAHRDSGIAKRPTMPLEFDRPQVARVIGATSREHFFF